MNIIFQVDGGIGKNVAATAVCKAIKKQNPKDRLIVITGFPIVFFGNPHVDKVLAANDLLYFYQNHVHGQNVKAFLHNPSLETDFVIGNGHLIKVWCEMFGVKYSGELPELFLTNREQTFLSNQFSSPKPLMVIQSNGGQQTQQNKYSWTRDIPLNIAQRVVDSFANEYNVVHLRREDQLPLRNTTPVQTDFRSLAVLIGMSEKRLFINSFGQHTAAALSKPSVVCWVGNSPNQLGYEMHTNVTANPFTIKPDLRNSVYTKYNAGGNATEFPYNSESEIFDADMIIEALRNDKEEIPGESKTKNNLRIKERIFIDSNRGSMVAQRLSCMAGKVDLTDVKQVLDIGSWHLGQSIEFSSVFKNVKIDAFEPVPDSYQNCLNRLNTLDEQKKSRIKVHNLALTDKEGEIPFYPVDPAKSSTPNVGASSMFKFIDGLNGSPFGQNLIQGEIKVKANTLDNWCKDNNITEVDIMWVDVQGAELLVFKGAENILKSTRIIMTEVGLKPYYQGHTLKTDIDRFLLGLGFKELEGSFEVNVVDFEANVIYVKS